MNECISNIVVEVMNSVIKVLLFFNNLVLDKLLYSFYVLYRVKMMTLVELEPMLKEQSQQNFGVVMEGFSFGSTKISFTGSDQSVQKAREWFNNLLGQYKVLNYHCQAALIPSAVDRFMADSMSVVLCVQCNNGTICYAAQYMGSETMQVMLLVCGKEPMVQMALDILTRPEKTTVAFDSLEVLHKVKSQSVYNFGQLSQQHKVYICESATPTIVIRGYMKGHITIVENIFNQAKAMFEKSTITLSGSKMKISCFNKALAQHPVQAQIFFKTVHQSTSVEIMCTDQAVRLTGPKDKIKEAEKMIDSSEFLKSYRNQLFEFESHPNFMAQTKKYLTQKFDQRQLSVSVNCSMKKKAKKPPKGDLSQPNDTFNVWIESEDTQHFDLACQIIMVTIHVCIWL